MPDLISHTSSPGGPGGDIRVPIPRAFAPLFQPASYKVFYGGRDGAKSWSFADVLLSIGAREPKRILCTREFQSSIADSVYKVLVDQIRRLNLEKFYPDNLVQRNTICSVCGTEFIFKGLHHNTMEIKSTEGIDICWVEEAQMASNESWEVLIPTIRKEGSEIWVSFNIGQETDPTYERFVLNTPPDSIVRLVNYYDNPFHSPKMEKERLYLLRVDPEAHDHIWLGKPRKISDACIFKGKFRVDSFETPEGVELLFGADFGFSEDPATLIRFFIQGRKLFIEWEAYEVGVDLDDMPELYDRVPGSRKGKIKGDNARPETISYLKKKASISRPARNGRAASRMALPSCGSSRKSSSMKDANTPFRSSRITPGKKTASQERYCRSLLTSTTTVSTPSVMGWGTRSRRNRMPGLKAA